MSGIRIGNYELIAQLGTNAHGASYQAQDLGRGGQPMVCRELINAKGNQEQVFTADLTRLRHPHLASYVTTVKQGADFFLVRYWVAGQTLEELRQQAPNGIPEERAIELVCQALDALARAQEHGIAHGAVHPRNLILGEDGLLRVTDLGLAALVNAPATAYEDDPSCLPYRAPEQLRGEAYDTRADIYALGVVFYELLLGLLPFPATKGDAIRRARTGQVPLAPRLTKPLLPLTLETAVLRALAPKPEDRFQTPLEFSRTLREWLLRREAGAAFPLAPTPPATTLAAATPAASVNLAGATSGNFPAQLASIETPVLPPTPALRLTNQALSYSVQEEDTASPVSEFAVAEAETIRQLNLPRLEHEHNNDNDDEPSPYETREHEWDEALQSPEHGSANAGLSITATPLATAVTVPLAGQRDTTGMQASASPTPRHGIPRRALDRPDEPHTEPLAATVIDQQVEETVRTNPDAPAYAVRDAYATLSDEAAWPRLESHPPTSLPIANSKLSAPSRATTFTASGGLPVATGTLNDELLVDLDEHTERKRSPWQPLLAVAGLTALAGIPLAIWRSNTASPTLLSNNVPVSASPRATVTATVSAATASTPVTPLPPVEVMSRASISPVPSASVKPRPKASPSPSPRTTPNPTSSARAGAPVVAGKPGNVKATPTPLPVAPPTKPSKRVTPTPTPLPTPTPKAGKKAAKPTPAPTPTKEEKKKKKEEEKQQKRNGRLGGFLKDVFGGKPKSAQPTPAATPKKK